MHTLLREALRDELIRDATKKFARRGEFLIYGLAGTQKVLVTAAAYELNPRPTIILVNEREKISSWRDDLAELLPNVTVEELPDVNVSVSFAVPVAALQWIETNKSAFRLLDATHISSSPSYWNNFTS